MSNLDIILKLLLQLMVILAAIRVFGIIGRYLGQTQVVSEMVAGFFLGPSVFGWFASTAQQLLFPTQAMIGIGGSTAMIRHPSMTILYAISQLGLVLYMFLIGLEFKIDFLNGRMKSAMLISGTGIIVPFSIGIIAGLFLYGEKDLFGPAVSPWLAALFMGISISITAFPMLARILYESGFIKTRFGTITLLAGSLNDVIAWCILAIILASFDGSTRIALFAIGGGILYVMVMLVFGRPAIRSVLSRTYDKYNGLTMHTITLLLFIIMLCAWFTEAIGLSAIFGAFLLGVAMPKGHFADEFQEKIKYLTTSLLLPLYFVYSGLNTQIGLLNSTGCVKTPLF